MTMCFWVAPSAFPERIVMGTPAQRSLATSTVICARVSVMRAGSTPSSST